MKTKNYFFTFIFLLGFMISVHAGNVEENDAQKVAVNFYYEKHNQFQGTIDYKDIVIEKIITKESNGEPVLYAFNFQGGGFVIVSAEDAYEPVIGYAYTGDFPLYLDPNSNYGSFIQSYIEQIDFARENNLEAESTVSNMWNHLLLSNIDELLTTTDSRDIEPLVASLWNQDNPYNAMCPEDPAGPGGRVYAGCVATCMSQIMHYWRYPEVGEGSHSYYASGYGTQTANFGATNYSWDGMQNSINSNNPIPIAELQYHAGVAVEMMYGPDGSGAYSQDVDDALRDYFRYANAQYLDKSNYSASAWMDILKEELDLGRPMYYSGRTSDNSGHAFVCDGYQGNDFHFNFGWSGSNNGFYSLYNVGGFYIGQKCVRRFYPTEADYPYYASGAYTITERSGSITDGSGPVEDYLDNASASWLIDPQTTEDSITDITITFYEFETEANDVVTIYDGPTTSDPVLGTFSGTTNPGTIESTGNQVLITFSSDGSGTGPGFYLEYTTSSPTFCSGLVTFTEETMSFSDGSAGFNYNNSSTCMWKIQPEWATEITLYFTEFNTEENYDLVKVFDGTTPIGEFSGDEIPDPVVATSGMMFITFTSNGNTTGSGWEAYYDIINVGVDETTEFSGLNIYPNPADNVLNIAFQDEAESNYKIELLSITGNLVHQEAFADNSGFVKRSINIESLPKGVYIVRITSDLKSVNKRVVIE